jgi:hypothetical protein
MRLVRILVFVSAALICFDRPADAQVPGPRAIEIRLASDTDLERQARSQLERILARWDLSKWYFTRAVQIESGATPHSHPVLTLNTNGLANDSIKSVSFIHEQLHWFLSRHHAATDSAIADLRLRYPDAPTEDAGDRESTYLHLLVGMLEFNATQELFGQAWARERLSKVPFYKWVYQEILERPEPIRQILRKHGLDSPDART